MKPSNKTIPKDYLNHLQILYGTIDTMYAKRVDENQKEIIESLRNLGASVQVLSSVGKGCPDLLIGINGYNLLIEIKNGCKPLSARKLTDDQVNWHQSWKGNVFVACSIDDIVKHINFVNKLSIPKKYHDCSTWNITDV